MITVSIQAGGRSRRMGGDKGLQILKGKPLVQHVYERVADLADEIILTTNNPRGYAFLGVRMVADEKPGAGALQGLRTALQAAHGEHVLVVACDMPFLQPVLLAYLLEKRARADVIVPVAGGYYEPMHAVYARGCLAPISECLAAGDNKVIAFFSQVSVLEIAEADLRALDPDLDSFRNINTQAELRLAELE